MNSQQPLMWSIVCDDVRSEVGNKLSYMGVYSGSIVVDQFPAKLPKLCIVMNVRVPVEHPLRRLVFRVLRDDTLLSTAEAATGQLLQLAREGERQAQSGESGEQPHITYTAIFTIVPLEIDAAAKLRLRADTDRGEIRGGSTPIVKSVAASAK